MVYCDISISFSKGTFLEDTENILGVTWTNNFYRIKENEDEKRQNKCDKFSG